MTTARSPQPRLEAQAKEIAVKLKAMERGDETGVQDRRGKIAAARARGVVTFAVVMDDKILRIEMPFETIRATDEAGIAEWIVRKMREEHDAEA